MGGAVPVALPWGARVSPERTAEREAWKAVVLAPLITWMALLALLATTVAYALWPHGVLKPVVALSISAAKATLIAIVFMRLNKATPLIRLAAGAGLVWLSIMFALLFVDYMTRAA